MKIMPRAVVLLFTAVYFVLEAAFLPASGLIFPIIVFAQEDERAELERQLADLERQINEYEAQVLYYKSQGEGLKSEINRLNAKISSLNLKIKSVNLSLRKLDNEIRDTNVELDLTQKKIKLNQQALADSIRRLYESERQGLIMLVLRNERLSDFFGVVTQLLEVQNTLSIALAEIRQLKNKLVNKSEVLGMQRRDAAALKMLQTRQKALIENTKSEKARILALIKNKEKKYKELLEDTKEKAAEIRNRIFRLLGGGEITFGEAVKLAKAVENAVGIRAALVLAVLTQESAVNGIIGKNLGKCYYNTPWNNRSGTVMSDRQKPSFFAILRELGMNPDTTPVSCPIAKDGAYGGAIGPAQFMPTTWWDVENNTGFKMRVAKLTGSNPPNPFNNLDAFFATGLYLKDAYDSESCVNYANQYKHIVPAQLLRERCAAAKYYAGGNWWYHRLGYGDDVAQRAIQFQKDIDILTSNNND